MPLPLEGVKPCAAPTHRGTAVRPGFRRQGAGQRAMMPATPLVIAKAVALREAVRCGYSKPPMLR